MVGWLPRKWFSKPPVVVQKNQEQLSIDLPDRHPVSRCRNKKNVHFHNELVTVKVEAPWKLRKREVVVETEQGSKREYQWEYIEFSPPATQSTTNAGPSGSSQQTSSS